MPKYRGDDVLGTALMLSLLLLVYSSTVAMCVLATRFIGKSNPASHPRTPPLVQF
jgi:hypothetical protein